MTNLNKLLKPLKWMSLKRRKAFVGLYVTPEQEKLMRWLMSAMTFLDAVNESPGQKEREAQGQCPGYISAYFGQWLSGLCFELAFPKPFAEFKLTVFEESKTFDLIEPEKFTMDYFMELFPKARSVNARLYSMLFSIWSLGEVRQIDELT